MTSNQNQATLQTQHHHFRTWLNSQLRAGFMPRTLVSLTLLAISLGLAILLYSCIQVRNQEALFTAWLSADPIPAFCNGFPHLSRESCGAQKNRPADSNPPQPPDDLSQLLYALFLGSEVINTRTYPTSKDFTRGLSNDLHATRKTLNTLLQDHRNQTGGQTGLELITKLSFDKCWNKNLNPKADLKNSANITAYILSDGPGGNDSWRGERSCSAARVAAGNLDFSAPTQTWHHWRLSASACLGPRDAIRVLMQKADAISRGPVGSPGYNLNSGTDGCLVASGWTTSDNKPLSPTEFLAAQDHMTRIIETLLSEMAATPAVKGATTTLRMWRGAEHIGILTLSIFVILVLSLRIFILWHTAKLAQRKQAAATNQHAFAVAFRLLGSEGAQARRDYDEGGAYLRWAIGSIPAIGFIGTVRGIFSALPESSEVVFAASRIERAEAIGTLAGELGLAFSTTLFALIAGLILSFIMLLATRQEAWRMNVLRKQVKSMPSPTESTT